MDKLAQFIPQFRIKSETKKTIQQMADKKHRKLNEFVRIALENLAQDYKEGKWNQNNY